MTPDKEGIQKVIQEKLARVRDLVAAADRVAVLSGAGISAASGIPTFRGAQDSMWSRYRPEDLATPEAFARDPELVWRWYDWRRELIAASGPNPAHTALARLEDHTDVTVITQNVDGYHQQSGSRKVLEFHGSIWRVRCTACGDEIEDRRVPLPIPPRCDKCGGLLRPGVVWFGEGIDPDIMTGSTVAVSESRVLLVIGTAGMVHPAAGLADLARANGVPVCEFNVEASLLTPHVDIFIPGDAAETLPRIVP